MKTFDNHPPINFDSTERLAKASRDGGAYSGIGHNSYTIEKGKKVHLFNSFSSGCEFNGRVDRSSTYIHGTDTTEEMIAYLVSEESGWWTNELLEQLGYKGEEA